MIPRSSKYDMYYYSISSLESMLDKKDLHLSLWQVRKDVLVEAMNSSRPEWRDKVLSVYKDFVTQSKNGGSCKIFTGIFLVVCEKELTPGEMKILFAEYMKEYPDTPREVRDDHMSSITESGEDNEVDDFNRLADDMDNVCRVYGVLDDLKHLDALSSIESIEIFSNVGDFKKIYFSIPAQRREEVLALSVTLISEIKCKESLNQYMFK